MSGGHGNVYKRQGNLFDCAGYGQSDRFVKTAQKIDDYIAQEHKCGGVSRADVMTQGV